MRTVIFLMLLSIAGSLMAAENRARDVALKWNASDQGFHDSMANLQMILVDRQGNRAIREMVIRTLESPELDEGDKSLVIFESPDDIKGTALLSHAHILEPDDQWLYLPALGRIKRISSANKSGSFVGSEFAYEDIAGMEVNKYEYAWLRREPCDDRECAVLEQTPRYERSGYTRLVAWYDLVDYQLRKIDYYDRKNVLLKTLTFSDYRPHDDRYGLAHALALVHPQTVTETALV
ncbi:MAG: outer membrane lipoprotein-sorting protein, partial [Pseudomonadales bacterium]|nr:outer membrane lipoprotein-sorting protein [Pseudomonadales bacterium]